MPVTRTVARWNALNRVFIPVPPEPYARVCTKEQAEAAGFEVIVSNPHLLLLDLDKAEDFQTFVEKMIPRLQEVVTINLIQWKHSKSGRWHAVIEVANELSENERWLLEMAMGSDRCRGLHNYKNMRNGEKNVGMLFTVKSNSWNIIYPTTALRDGTLSVNLDELTGLGF